MADDQITSNDAPGEVRWYLPTWGERLRLMGWRLIYFVPAVLVLLLGLAGGIVAPILLLSWWKVLAVVVVLPIIAAMNAAKHAVRQRKEPFCIHCGYNLTGLPDGHICPECGVRFHHAEIDDYRRDPHWYIRRQQLNRTLPESGAAIDAGPKRTPKRKDGT